MGQLLAPDEENVAPQLNATVQAVGRVREWRKGRARPATFGRASSRWLSEEYYVVDSYVAEIIKWLGQTPQVDGFANEANHRFPRWWGEGSP